MISFPGRFLNSDPAVENTLYINAVGYRDEREGDMYDNFLLKNVVCFYHLRDFGLAAKAA